nr:restriction endonuclease subunit S [Pectobacterium colocasium]
MTFDKNVNKVREQFIIRNADILMALSGATVGKIAVADSESEGAYLNQRVAIIRGKCYENTEYLKYVFSGGLLQKLLLNAGGAAQPNLSPKDLAGMEIPLPL